MRSRARAAAIALGAITLSLTALPAGPAASGAESTTRVVRLAPRVPNGARHLGRLPDARELTFDVVLAPSHQTELQALLEAQRDPSSPSFGHYLARGEFVRRFGPTAQQVDAATAWLHAQGLRDTTVDGFAVKATATAGVAARAFGVSMERYRTTDGRDTYVASGAPLVPAALADGITALVGLSGVAAAHPMLDTTPRAAARERAVPLAGVPAPCAAASSAAGTRFWTPDKVGAMYGVGDLLGAGQNGTGKKIAVVELAPHSAADTAAYLSCFGLTNTVATKTIDGGGTVDAGGTLEANIDIEEAATQAPRAAIVSYEGPNTGTGEYDVYHQIVTDDTAQAVSVSWGLCEAASGGSFMDALGTLLAQAAAQGQSVVAASGDSGSEDCFGNTTSTNLGVDSPADDPHVTGVGGTSLNAVGNEPVWNDCEGQASYAQCQAALGGNGGAGGGGKSTHFTRPAWQPLQPGGTCPLSSCRQVPDISANAGVGEVFRSGGGWLAVGGTSIAAPKVAGIVADVATACTAPLGDLAPRLTALAVNDPQQGYGTALGDVTAGDNDLTRNHAGLFPATAGPDVATGLGVPVAAGWSCPQVTSLDTAGGDPGATVTITGFGLADATIYFGATPATIVSRSAAGAVVLAPAGSGTVAVRGANAMGLGTHAATFTYNGSATTSSTSTSTTSTTTPAPTTTTTVPRAKSTKQSTPNAGYRTVAADGGIFDFGGARFYGSTGGIRLNQPIVGMTNDVATGGYWFVASDGGVFGFHAPFYGSTAGMALGAPVLGMAATPTGRGYWIAVADGRVFAFGDARDFGSVTQPRAPIAGIAPTHDGKGYWLAGRDGSVYPFGDARDLGSMSGTPLSRPIVGIAADVGTGGYWMVASDGGIFGFGAPFYGSTGAIRLNQPIVGIAPTKDGRGYWMVALDGGIFSFGDARFTGSMGGSPLNQPMVGIAAAR